MDIFSRFNRNQSDDRRIDTLIGLSKGIIANGNVDQAEAEFLMTWLAQNAQSEQPIIINLLDRVSAMLDDNILDVDESTELFNILHTLSGDNSEFGEIAKPSKLPLTSPQPPIIFDESIFLFTGTFAFGPRRECEREIISRSGFTANTVTKKLDYLVIGSYVTDTWAHETFGRKIQKAMEYNDAGENIRIVSESHWANELDKSPTTEE